MKNEIKVPSLGESISEAVIGQIITPSGSMVKADSEILELETDKVNQVLYAPSAGKVNFSVKTGDKVKIGETIGVIESEGFQEEAAKPKEKEKKPKEKEKAIQPELATQSISEPKKPPEKVSEKTSEQPEKISLLKKGMAIRLTKEKFLSELKEGVKAPEKKSVPDLSSRDIPPSISSTEPTKRETRRPMSKIRKIIAQRMVEAQHTMAMLTTFNEIDLTQVIQIREKYKEEFLKKYGSKLGFMSFFVKATVAALQAFPDLNSYIQGEEIVHREYYDIGVAVGTEKGVIVPVIRDCNHLTYAEIELAIESYAKKARDGTLSPKDLQGGGFTITNGGVYGSLLSTPIVLPPQCGILGMHKIEKRPVVINDEIAIRSMMYVALSYDHRLIDGKEAVSFLVHIKKLLEDSSRILLEI